MGGSGNIEGPPPGVQHRNMRAEGSTDYGTTRHVGACSSFSMCASVLAKSVAGAGLHLVTLDRHLGHGNVVRHRWIDVHGML